MKKYILVIIMLLTNKVVSAQEQINNLVVPVSYFINHVSQLEKLGSNLTKYKQSSIVGISGMGKTQLARMYAYENKANYALIWFIDCNLDIEQQLLRLAKSINTQLKSPMISEDVAIVRKDLMTYLASKDRWLLVFDNLKIKENKKVADFINWEHNGNVIFCSQDSELLPHIIKVNAFSKTESIALAKNILENKNPESIEFLAQEFGGYPILMVQGAQLLNQVQGLNLEEYKKKIRASDDKIELNIKLAINELKPTAKKLLNEIALINNQSFSKELLNSITEDKNTLDDDIYQLSKFALISNIDPNEVNPVFEMHDIIVEKILQINGSKENKKHLEQLATNLLNSIPKSVVKGRIFRNAKTVSENIEIITKNAEKYDVSIYKLLELKLHLIVQAINSSNLNNAKKLVDWLDNKDQEKKFKLWKMNNEEKRDYAAYLGLIGWYYRNCADHQEAIKYDKRAKEVFDEVKGYDSFKCNVIYGSAISNIERGDINEAEKNIQIIENMFNQNLVDKADIATLYYAKAKLFFIQGKYDEALKQIDNSINICVENGMNPQDLYLTGRYILKVEILNNLGRYQEAYSQAEQVYNMNKLNKKEDQQIFGHIFTQMSRAELGLKKAKEALEYARKAKTIYINDPMRPNNNIITSPDIYLAKAFVAEGDALAALNKNEEAATSYATAENIYWNNYRDNMKNVDEISIMYLAAAKASCGVPKDSAIPQKFWYKKFRNHHIEKFGGDHPRSREILNLKCYSPSY
ncbi:tetratricopeptide repeat protein [Rickettsia endosymbiont of Orchestes rusci]|uniref:tetratricopeptide repeat protein n=1 Tax=Rickettsia endosymbiont of Orchestes rusci TaxID=3066250 RepID=UPI00313AD567